MTLHFHGILETITYTPSSFHILLPWIIIPTTSILMMIVVIDVVVPLLFFLFLVVLFSFIVLVPFFDLFDLFGPRLFGLLGLFRPYDP